MANSETGFNWIFDSERAVQLDDAAAKEVLRMRAKYQRAVDIEEEKKDGCREQQQTEAGRGG